MIAWATRADRRRGPYKWRQMCRNSIVINCNFDFGKVAIVFHNGSIWWQISKSIKSVSLNFAQRIIVIFTKLWHARMKVTHMYTQKHRNVHVSCYRWNLADLPKTNDRLISNHNYHQLLPTTNYATIVFFTYIDFVVFNMANPLPGGVLSRTYIIDLP